MTAREEIEKWKRQSLKLETEEERRIFYEAIEKKILAKNKEAKQAHLQAFRDSIDEFSKNVKIRIEHSEIKVYPSSKEEVELLKNLFQKMNIRFELS